ncbi:MAG: c-type cytochrome [Deltaproteobacteria bacterium]|nr:c-type cytochrome [Deltaproteobacteria bacterium]
MHLKKWNRPLIVMIGSFLFGLPLQEGWAQEQEVAAVGKPLYEDNCMVCHGHKAKGDGPMVTFGLLSVPVPALTQLSKRNNGHFPFWKVYRIIDGREEVKGHGAREMPLWGDEFRMDVGSSAMLQTEVRGKILSLVYYLQSVQEK